MQLRNALHQIEPKSRTGFAQRTTTTKIFLKHACQLILGDAAAGIVDFNMNAAPRLTLHPQAQGFVGW